MGSSPAVQLLELGTFTAMAQVQSLVRVLKSYKLHYAAKNKVRRDTLYKYELIRARFYYS